MSRLWSRFGVRALAIGLLLAGASGGYYLAEERRTQQAAVNARLVAQAEQEEREILREYQRAYLAATAQQRAAEREAAEQAAEAAKAATEWARQAAAAASRRKAREEAERKAALPYTGPIPESCNEYSGNRRIGCALLLEAGFNISEMPCLDKLWTKESGWNPKSSNSATGAYGIPQALPGSKMASVGDDWETNPATQIKWGLGYVKGRYDTPCGAWTFFQERGYY